MMRFRTVLRCAGLALTAIALIELASRDGGEAPSLPARLSETGLYDGIGAVDPRNAPFVPQYPLWSDGAEKSRWIRLPEGTKIDTSDVDVWRFPVGTKFWKQFSWNGRKIETRMIWKAGEDDWVFAAYRWREDQSDAVLAPETGVHHVREIAPGKRHSIPGIEDCNACHRSSPSVILGFNALQLSDDRDPLAPHRESLPPDAVTLAKLIEGDRLHPRRPELVATPPRIRESDPVARAALGYLSANCGGCHNEEGPLARLGLVLLHDAAGTEDSLEPARATTVDVASREYRIPGIPSEESRIVSPGVPDHSSLLYRMNSRRPLSQMPPLGTVIPDAEAVDLIRSWIESLAERTPRRSQPGERSVRK